MLQGMATGKLGDVVFARANGEQISRVRNRHPKNPRTNKQMYQRAVMATVMQAYSAGQEIFNHAFQGKSVGAENQRAFLSKNSKLLRGLIAAELEAGTSALNCNAAVVAPGAITPVPNEYMISEGTYQQAFFGWDGDDMIFKVPQPTTGETVAQYADRNGLVAGDIYTMVVMSIGDLTPMFTVRGVESVGEDLYQPASQYPCVFSYLRLQVKDVRSNSTVIENGDLSLFFEVTASHNAITSVSTVKLNDSITPYKITGTKGGLAVELHLATIGCIRSRLDQDLRSTSFMHVASRTDFRSTSGMYGITSPLALAAWQQGTEALGDSDLILEGGDE